ncbi:MAG: glutamyl-tRNA reductase [Deltaproteobacteria bacterium]|nr:glutamyl-tRNA reductase [Deltaproteobacteria bacterium]
MTGELVVVGLSHRTAPIAVREKLAVAGDDLSAITKSILEAGAAEAMIVSTCNRVEVYAVGGSDLGRSVRATLTRRAGGAKLDAHLYEHRGTEAVRHLFRVTSSLDSMVVGEPQILGQVKEAFGVATEAGTIGPLLGRCLHRAFGVAKRVRTETGIAEGSVSVSSVAVDLARGIFSSLAGRTVLLVGAGKMGRAASQHLVSAGAKLLVTNRSPERATALADDVGGEARPWESLRDLLVAADVVVCSTSAPGFVLTHSLVAQVVKARRHRQLFVIDIAVPRDVDPAAGQLDNVFLYDVDDLQKVCNENLQARGRERDAAEKLVEGEVGEIERWRKTRGVSPLITALRAHVLAAVRGEIDKTAGKLRGLAPEDKKSLEVLAEAITSKVVHPALVELRRAAQADPDTQEEVLGAATRMFGLPDPRGPETPDTEGGHPVDDGSSQKGGASNAHSRAEPSSSPPSELERP